MFRQFLRSSLVLAVLTLHCSQDKIATNCWNIPCAPPRCPVYHVFACKHMACECTRPEQLHLGRRYSCAVHWHIHAHKHTPHEVEASSSVFHMDRVTRECRPTSAGFCCVQQQRDTDWCAQPSQTHRTMLALMGSCKLHHGEQEIVCVCVFIFPFYVLSLAVCETLSHVH